tara:strand:+ start:4371 stop:4784 length:414 start_codon:yes stop_codon:yes gene_type:complete
MKINRWWKLDCCMIPQKLSDVFQRYPAGKEEYDNSTIIHFGRYFRPIVLTDIEIFSGDAWGVFDFWKDLNTAISLCKKKAFNDDFFETEGEWEISRDACLERNEIFWGCRTFTLHQLQVIRQAMKDHYGIRYLNGAN